jgi:hypothetical protein
MLNFLVSIILIILIFQLVELFILNIQIYNKLNNKIQYFLRNTIIYFNILQFCLLLYTLLYFVLYYKLML